MELTNIAIYKLLLPFKNLIFAFGGWLAGLFLLIIKPEELSRKILIFRAGASILAIPLVMIIDYKINLDKWSVCGIAIMFSYFGWLVLDIAEKKLPKVLNKKIDNYLDGTGSEN